YFVYPPLAFNTASTLLGMLSTNSWHTEDSIFSHSTLTLSHNSNIPFGAVSYPWSFLFRCAHRCSIGLRSGDCAGHVRTSISFSWNQALAFLHLCLGSLSCWKITSTGFFLKYLILDCSSSSKILTKNSHPSFHQSCMHIQLHSTS